MITDPLFGVGILMICAYLGGRAANAIRLPRVSGYLLVGMLLGPSFSNFLSRSLIESDCRVITEIALSVIAYSIGGSLVFERLKRIGSSILWITVYQALGAFLCTTAFLLPAIPFLTGLQGPEHDLHRTYLPLALVIGAISVATASGAILAIINELRASGPFTVTLLGVIAISYALTIVLFTSASAVSHALIHPGSGSCSAMLLRALAEIGCSMVLGVLAGIVLKLLALQVRRREALMMVVLGVLFCTSGLAALSGLSPLLANMVLGLLVVNLERRHQDFFLVIEQVEEPLFGLFFGLGGAHIDLSVLDSAGLLALAIIAARMTGKHVGAWVGASLSRAPESIRKYLGLGLSPQAGWTIGLVLIAQKTFPVPLVENILVNAVIGSVIISQLVGLPLVRYALLKAGESLQQRRIRENSASVG